MSVSVTVWDSIAKPGVISKDAFRGGPHHDAGFLPAVLLQAPPRLRPALHASSRLRRGGIGSVSGKGITRPAELFAALKRPRYRLCRRHAARLPRRLRRISIGRASHDHARLRGEPRGEVAARCAGELQPSPGPE